MTIICLVNAYQVIKRLIKYVFNYAIQFGIFLFIFITFLVILAIRIRKNLKCVKVVKKIKIERYLELNAYANLAILRIVKEIAKLLLIHKIKKLVFMVKAIANMDLLM